VFNHPPQFSRAKYSLRGKPDAAGRLTIIYQTCGHMHDSRDAALACDFGGEFLYERRAETFEQLSQADQNRNAKWSQDDAKAVVTQAIAPLEPTERRARPLYKVTARGGRFDIYMIHAGHLCGEYEAAIREAFGARMGSFRCE
jgi:uncharacterized protein with NAD-binding domain and iron-sulfur cluster